MAQPKHIAIIEDNTEIARLASILLESEGYTVSQVYHGDQALTHIQETNPDIVILDINLPGKNGIEICREARVFYRGIILMLTASKDDITELSSLKSGADDYITKPIRPHILVARLETLTRRLAAAPNENLIQKPVISERLSISIPRREVMLDGNIVNLTSSEFDVLSLLVENTGKTVSRDVICELIRGIHYNGFDRSVDMRISSLRRKLDDDKAPHRLIKTIRGKGYMLVAE